MSLYINYLKNDILYEKNSNRSYILSDKDDTLNLLKIVVKNIFYSVYDNATENILITDSYIFNLKKISNNEYIIQSQCYKYGFKCKIIRIPYNKSTMIPKKMDDRIGYFTNSVLYDTKEKIEDFTIGNRYALINKLDIKKIPWTFHLHSNIPIKYKDAIKRGILSWNNYFNSININNPLNVSDEDTDNDYPDDNYKFIIKSVCVNGINNAYAGVANFIPSLDTGEIMYGMVYICIDKIESLPSIHYLLSGYNDNEELNKLINMNFSHIIAHEVGHILGLRHNFTGSLYPENFGSIMDYSNIFSYLLLENINDIINKYDVNKLRKYDLIALKYGYTNDIIEYPNIPFGTDENITENWLQIIYHNTEENSLLYVKKCINIYSTYRKNLKDININKYTYNVLFYYIYIKLYKQIIDICLKYIGGRKYYVERNSYEYISKKETYDALNLLFEIIKNLDYNKKESSFIIYDTKNIENFYTNFIDENNIYNMGKGNVKKLYDIHINYILADIIKCYSRVYESNTSYYDILLYIHDNFIFKNYLNKFYIKKCFIELLNTNNKDINISAEIKSILSTIKYNCNNYIKLIPINELNDQKIQLQYIQSKIT